MAKEKNEDIKKSEKIEDVKNNKSDEQPIKNLKTGSLPINDNSKLSNYEILSEITKIQNKLDEMSNSKIPTKEIINITKETLENEKIKNKKIYIFYGALITILIFLSLCNINYYFFMKTKQEKIITQKLNENILTEVQIEELTKKINGYNKIIEKQQDDINKIKQELNNCKNASDEENEGK